MENFPLSNVSFILAFLGRRFLKTPFVYGIIYKTEFGGTNMKTFKIVALQIIEDNNLKDIPLMDGLIINKEDEKQTWLIEAYIDAQYYDYFSQAQQKNGDIDIQVVITHEANDPAPFKTHIHSINKLGNCISVLFEGHLKAERNEYAELILSKLLAEGLSGEALLREFKQRMRVKPRLAAKKTTT